MENNIYDLLNEIEIDLNEYNKQEFTDIEKQKIIKFMKRFTKKNKLIYPKYIAVACSLILVTTLFATPLGSKVLAYKQSLIASFKNIHQNITPYTTTVDQEISKNGITVKFNDAILDNDTFITSITMQPTEKIYKHCFIHSRTLTINNKKIYSNSTGIIRQSETNSFSEISTYPVKELYNLKLSGDLNIKYEIEDILLNDEYIKGPWIFEFTTNGDELAANTIKIPLNYSFTLENTKKITLTTYTSNNVGQKIYFTLDSNGTDYDMMLKGHDDLGNEIEFDLSTTNGNSGIFEIYTFGDTLPDNAKSIMLTPYAVKYHETSGRLSNDFKPVGEEFTINLVK